jgi:hypothetical protein
MVQRLCHILLTVFVACFWASIARADPADGHDIPFSMADVRLVETYCESEAESPRPDSLYTCNQLREHGPEAMLEKLESLRQICIEWAEIEPRVKAVVDLHGSYFWGLVDPLDFDVLCSVPRPLRALTFAAEDSDPKFLEVTLQRLYHRVERAERASARSAQLKQQLVDAHTSLRLQNEEGKLRPELHHELFENLELCDYTVDDGPYRMMSGDPYDDWEVRASMCVNNATRPVFERAKRGPTADLRPMWWGLAILLAGGLGFFALWSRRHRRTLAQLELAEWAQRIDHVRFELERLARDARNRRRRAECNLMLARLDALDTWAAHFSDDATPSAIEHSAKHANISSPREFTWSGYADDPEPPVGSVSGHPEDMLRRVEEFVAR